ncbi:TlpA disulfide reductase family protein [Balneolaceae bacterium ANBcel3]|nr:TlpA disulfide reductase family protein [Balneolaceae bacterium ANBcel3]
MDIKGKLVVLLFIAILVGTCSYLYQPVSAFSISEEDIERVRNAKLSDWNGSYVQVSDFEGKIVVVDFWETWCGSCLGVFSRLQTVQEEYPEDLVVIAATPGWRDTAINVRTFRNANDFDFVFVEARKLASEIRLPSIPLKIIFDRNGNFVKYQAGATGTEDKDLKELIATL